MTVKSHEKLDCIFWRKPNLWFGKNMRNLANFYQNTWKCQNWDFDGILLPKVENAWAKNLQESCVMAMKNDAKYEEELTCQFKIWHGEFDEFWPKHSKISKICSLMGCFWLKYIMFELKKYRGVMFDGTEDWSKIWRKTDLCFQNWHETGWKIAISF